MKGRIRKMKKIGTFFMALIIMVCTIHLPVDASEIVCSDTIPDKMQPETIISFISDDKYIIEKGGISQEKHEIVLPEEIADKIQTAKNDGSYYTAYHAELPDPVEGLKVYYADDGYILRFVYPEGVENPLMKEVKSPNENIVRKETREGPGPNDTLLYTWGAHNNQIWKIAYSSTARLGFGRATNFTDRIGQRDNVLKKGDAATSLAYDNCAYGRKSIGISPSLA